MRIVHQRTNHMVNPLGYTLGCPTVSWKITEAEGKFTKNAKIKVALDETMETMVYECEGKDLHSYGTPLKFLLKESTRYYWQVEVVSDKGEKACSQTAWFETAKNDRNWEAEWITSDFGSEIREDGVLCRDFVVEKKVKKARLSITGVGLYEVYIDGRKVGDEYLTPNFNDYSSWIQFQTYEAEEYLAPGRHRMEILLGSGWYKGRHLTFNEGTPDCKYGNVSAAIAELSILYEDEKRELIRTDRTWEARRSRIRANGLYDGEETDAAFDVSQVFPVKTANMGTERLMARLSLPVRKKLTVKPKKFIVTPKGELLLDFGQNMAGWVVFYDRLQKGGVCRMTGAEVLQDGCFYHENMRSAKTEFTYRSDGQHKWVRPHFTYYGFRYMKLEGFAPEVCLDDFEAWVLYSDMEETGFLETGNGKVNQLISNILWGQRSNFIDVPTDCPQRDERLGWTGDTQVFCATASFNMDTQEFYRKHMHDVWCEQQKNSGMVPMVVPDLFLTASSAAWGDVAAIVPWVQYQMYGDRELLKEQYPGMRAWVEYIYQMDQEDGAARLWKCGTHFGDWLSLDAPDGRATGGTDVHFIATAYYYYSTMLLCRAAKVLGYEEDAQKYGLLGKEIREAFIREYYTGSGRLAVDTQTAYALVLYFHLYPEGSGQMLVRCLADKLHEYRDHLVTGFVGTPLLCPVLSECGHADLAYTLLLNEDFPGWLYAVNMGATTVWERWDSIQPDGTMHPDGMNSLNHYAYGAVQEWMYQYAAGIRRQENSVAWEKILLRPMPDERLGRMEACFDSPFGKIVSRWEYRDEKLFLCFEVPFDTEAEICLPDGRKETVCAGRYDYEIDTSSIPRKPEEDKTLEELARNREISKLLWELVPEIMHHKEDTYRGKTLKECVSDVFNVYTLLDLKALQKKIEELYTAESAE